AWKPHEPSASDAQPRPGSGQSLVLHEDPRGRGLGFVSELPRHPRPGTARHPPEPRPHDHLLRGRTGRRAREQPLDAGGDRPGRASPAARRAPWFNLHTPQEVEPETRKAGEAIEAAPGRRTVGFRGPGYSFSAETLRVLVRRKYQYDCSSLPTFLGPLARAY